MDCGWQHYTPCSIAKVAEKAVNTVLVAQAMQRYDQVRKQDHGTPHRAYFAVFSLKDKGVRVSPSTCTGRHLTSASLYIDVRVSVVYIFICHDFTDCDFRDICSDLQSSTVYYSYTQVR